jgi:hypothetical protein
MPMVGFYLQPAVGGIQLAESFWRRFAAIDNVIAIKMAPFHRYRTLDVIRGVVAAGAERPCHALHRQRRPHRARSARAVHLACATARTVTRAHSRRAAGALERMDPCVRCSCWIAFMPRVTPAARSPLDLLALDSQVTDCNAALFDVAHDFHGCIAGCHEVLRRQGLLAGTWCLDPAEGLSPGQGEALTRVAQDYPHLTDDAFVAAHLARWLA